MKIKKMINKAKTGLTVVGGALMLSINSAMAEGVDGVVEPLTNLNTLIEAILKGVGAVLLLWNIGQLAFGIMQNDPQGKQSALKGISGGLILVSSGFVLQFILS